MIPALIGIGAGVSALSGLVGFLVENGKEKEAQEILARAGSNYNNISLPELQRLSEEVLGPSAFEQIRTTPEFKAAQLEGLDTLRQLQEGGGFSIEDRANLNRVRNQVNQQDQGRQAAILENMQARGIAGGGAELAARLSSAQNAMNVENQAGLDTAAQARNRFFQAVRERTNLAGNMRNQDFDEQSRIAQARDARDVFNYGARRDAQTYNNTVAQNNFNNRLTMADRRYGVAQDRAGALRNQGQRQGQVAAGVGNALGGGLSMWGAYGGSGGSQYQQPGLDPMTNVREPKMMPQNKAKNPWEEEDDEYGV